MKGGIQEAKKEKKRFELKIKSRKEKKREKKKKKTYFSPGSVRLPTLAGSGRRLRVLLADHLVGKMAGRAPG